MDLRPQNAELVSTFNHLLDLYQALEDFQSANQLFDWLVLAHEDEVCAAFERRGFTVTEGRGATGMKRPPGMIEQTGNRPGGMATGTYKERP